jgi:HipA-like kinase
MRGAAQAYLIECDDGHSYVVKFRNNPQHQRILVNEWIASRILAHLGISTPEIMAVYLTEDFIEQFQEVHIRVDGIRLGVEPGPHFGSRYAGSQTQNAVYDFLPGVLFERIVNMREFVGALVVDKWIGNVDARQAIFCRSQLSLTADTAERRGFQASMIDQGSAFGGGEWKFYDLPHQGLFEATAIYQPISSWEDFQPWLYEVVHFPAEVLREFWDEVPEEWISAQEAELDELFDKLLARRKRVPGLIVDSTACGNNPFPRWEWFSRNFPVATQNT